MAVACSEVFQCSSAITNPKNRGLCSVVHQLDLMYCCPVVSAPRPTIHRNTGLGVSEEACCCTLGSVLSCVSGSALHFFPAALSGDIYTAMLLWCSWYNVLALLSKFEQHLAVACLYMWLCSSLACPPAPLVPCVNQPVLLSEDLSKMHPSKLNRWVKQVKNRWVKQVKGCLSAIVLLFPSKQGFECCSIIPTWKKKDARGQWQKEFIGSRDASGPVFQYK